MEKLDLEQLKQIIKEVVIEAMQEFEESKTKEVSDKIVDTDCEIDPSKKYNPRDAHKLLGYSLRYLYDLCDKGDIDYEINRRTGYRMFKGVELIKFRNNNPTKY